MGSQTAVDTDVCTSPAANASEWVYLAPLDEPSVFEADAQHPPTDKPYTLFDSLFSSSAPAEEPQPSPDAEPEFFGDQDIIDDRIPPEKAFEQYLGTVYRHGEMDDFSGSVAPPPSRLRNAPPSASDASHRATLPGTESRAERLARLKLELDDLENDYRRDERAEGQHAEETQAALLQLSHLHERLHSVQNASLNAAVFNLSLSHRDAARDTNFDADASPVPLAPSADVELIATLESRVATLERAFGLPELDDDVHYDGPSIATLLHDLRDSLDALADDTLPARLKRDAGDIANILHAETHSDAAAAVVQTAVVLKNMSKWEHLAHTVPVVVERLRSLKRLHQEAASFETALTAVGRQVDDLERRQSSNASLLDDVKKSMQINAKAVQENIDILRMRLSDSPS